MDPVQVERFYLGCLAHASYLIVSGGTAAVVDPQRDVDIYLEAAAGHHARIEHIIETHLHADFVSGHRELADRTGARVWLGEGSGARFPHTVAREGERIEFGGCRLEFLQTPGHTIESVSIVLTDLAQPGRPRSVFTGDTLFVGDVGRPDLAPDHTPQQLAALLYRSLHEKLLTLPDETEVLPAHGAGSLCGRQLSAEGSSTIGRERRSNYALQAGSADEFIHLLTDSLPARPEYFARDVELNRQGAPALETLPPPAALSPGDVARLQTERAIVLDTRPAMEFAAAHIPGAIHIALTGQYASWAARLLGLDQRFILCAEDEERVRESQLRLARVGIENVAGYLDGGIAAWVRDGRAADYIPQVSVADLRRMLADEAASVAVVDVRERAETEAAAIPGSIRIPLGEIPVRAGEIDSNKLVVVHCKGGYRSSIATSLLRRAGVRNLANLTGGFDAWNAAATSAARG
jgi:hydroxyacylglutathione hydrolase